MAPTRPRLDSAEQHLQDKIDNMFDHTRYALVKSIDSLRTLDKGMAAEVVEEDGIINKLQLEIEERSSLAIARQQPVATDLRQLMSDIYISMELERIADHAAAIANIVMRIDGELDQSQVNTIFDIAELCASMLDKVKQAYDTSDVQLATDTAAMDQEIDDAEEAFNDYMLNEICRKENDKRICTYMMWITDNLERIGDRAANIAERIIYVKTSSMPALNG